MTDWWWQPALSLLGGLALVWLVLVSVLYAESRRRHQQVRLRDAARLVPDVIRLFRRLAADSSLPRRVRASLALLLLYLASPIDLVPDFIPVIGYVDDALIVAIALRSVTRHAGSEAIDRHWPGTPDGLRTIKRFGGVAGV